MAPMQAWRRLRHWSMPLSITLCSTLSHASIRCRLKSFTSCALFWYTRCPRFCNEMYWGQGCSVARNLEVHTSLLHYCTFGPGAANDAQNVRADTARGKDNDQQNLSKMIMWYRSVYNQTASDASRYNNPVYKLMTDKLQLMLIN